MNSDTDAGMHDLVTVAVVPTLMEAEIVSGLLRASEIEAVIPDAETLRIEPHLAFALRSSAGFEVRVSRPSVDEAREILRSAELAQDNEPPAGLDSECPECGQPLVRTSSGDRSHQPAERCLACGYVRTEPSVVPMILVAFAAIAVAAMVIYSTALSVGSIMVVLIIAIAAKGAIRRLGRG